MLGGWPIRALRLEHDDRMVYPLGASFFTYVSIGASFGNLARSSSLGFSGSAAMLACGNPALAAVVRL